MTFGFQSAVDIATKEGWQVDIVYLYEKNLAYCKGCNICLQTAYCVMQDDIVELTRLMTACNTPAPFSFLMGQSVGAKKAMKEFFKTGGMKYAGCCVWTGMNKKEIPSRVRRKIEKALS